jgi:hypothetical protein
VEQAVLEGLIAETAAVPQAAIALPLRSGITLERGAIGVEEMR